MDNDLTDWLRLSLIQEIGGIRGGRLLKKFGTPAAILKAPVNALAEVEGIGLKIAQEIYKKKDKINLSEYIKIIETEQIKLITLSDERYPVNLKSIFDPPLTLFVKGEILPRDYLSVGIVGTRLASFYGISMAERLSRQLAENGFTVVSGGARGIDTSAHKSVLMVKGRTVAVLGCGLDTAYPPENRELFAQISQRGAVISEFPPLTEPKRQNFPMRNRIISGLSLGVVVIEAPKKSGALITVAHALEQGREVFSVPGQAGMFISGGSNQLLKEGAKLVENVEDIIEELKPFLIMSK